MATQKEICDYLHSMESNSFVEEDATLKIIGDQPVIGEELKLEFFDNARYFKISYSEIRTDQEYIQSKPMICLRNGYLRVSAHGDLSLTDNNFRQYQSSTIFCFEDGKLKTKINWQLADRKSRTHQCASRGLFAFGVFAALSVGGYVVAQQRGLVFKPL